MEWLYPLYVGVFENVVTQLPIIMAFQSLILDMAGNVGTQSLAVTIRVLMDESLTGKQKLELVFKEMRIGLCNGALLGILSFVLIGLYIYLFKGKTLIFAYAVSGCIGVALLLAMLISSAVGTCIPLFFKKSRCRPRRSLWPIDHHRQRPCCCCDILWTWLDIPHWNPSPGRLIRLYIESSLGSQ